MKTITAHINEYLFFVLNRLKFKRRSKLMLLSGSIETFNVNLIFTS